MIEGNNNCIDFNGTRYFGTGSSYTSSRSNYYTLNEVESGQSTFNMSVEPHSIGMYLITFSNNKDLVTKGQIPSDLVTISEVILPSIEGARYKIQNTISCYLPSGDSEDYSIKGWQGRFISFFSYPEDRSGSWDETPNFTKGQQITFKLTMKKPSGEVILDNKQITLNFT